MLEAEYEAKALGQGPMLIDMPLRRLLNFIYGKLMSGIPPEKRREMNNILDRAPGTESKHVPGVPIPAWMNDENIPDRGGSVTISP